MATGLAEGFVANLLLVFAAALPIVNPTGSALIFLDMTSELTHAERESLARQIAFYSFLVLNVSLTVGSYVLEFFGISIPALRVAGGAVVAAAGWRFLQNEDRDRAEDAARASERPRQDFLSYAFYPLTMPLTTGPGTISVMIALGTTHTSEIDLSHRLVFIVASLIATLALALLIYVCFAFADRVQKLLGNTGANIALRLSAFILFCIGVQIMWTGFSQLLASVKFG